MTAPDQAPEPVDLAPWLRVRAEHRYRLQRRLFASRVAVSIVTAAGALVLSSPPAWGVALICAAAAGLSLNRLRARRELRDRLMPPRATLLP